MLQSLSLPGPFGASSSSCTVSPLIVVAISAVCSAVRKSLLRGSTRSIGRSFALLRILHHHSTLDQHAIAQYTTHAPDKETYRGSHPASTKISTTAFPSSHSPLANPLQYLTALCKHVSPSLLSCPSISTPSWSSIMSRTS